MSKTMKNHPQKPRLPKIALALALAPLILRAPNSWGVEPTLTDKIEEGVYRVAQGQPAVDPAPEPAPSAGTAPADPVAEFEGLKNFYRARSEDNWLIYAGSPGWVSGMKGSMTVGGKSIPTELGLEDVVNTLKEYLDYGALLNLQARRGRWTIFGELMYLKMSGEFDGSAQLPPLTTGRPRRLRDRVPRRDRRELGPTATLGIDGEFTFMQTMVELGGGYRFFDRPYGESQKKRISLDFIAGVRYWRLDSTMSADIDLAVTRHAIVGGDRNHHLSRSVGVNGAKDWIDPFIGLQGQVDLTEKLFLYARGDIGGFGLGSAFSSELTWRAQAGLSYNVTPRLGLFAGYQVLDVDYEDGDFGFDMQLGGPVLGFGYTFGGPRRAAQ